MTIGKAAKAPDIPLLRPLLPNLEQLAPYLRQIDESRVYSNFGPLMRLLEERLAIHVGAAPGRLAVVANGTTALSAALLGVGAMPGKKCLVPSWTFVASAAAVCAANLVPHFIDVSRETWMPDPDELRRRSDLAEVGAVMIVAPFGMPFNTASWDAFWDETGIPVVIDAAACFDTAASIPASRPGRSAIMISLHATKVLGTGEGGLVVSTDEAIVRRVRQICNFGIWGTPEDQILGYNGKLSEYHAAVGLAALDAWPERRVALAGRTQRYVQELGRLPQVTTLPRYGDGWVSAYCTVRVNEDAGAVGARLLAMGVENRRWWRDGVHLFAAYRDFSRDDLAVTTELATSVLSLPFSHDITDAQIVRVVDCLERALDPEK
jgi:dTDP-4-amino-4,6-dideoxygalactose transaminase